MGMIFLDSEGEVIDDPDEWQQAIRPFLEMERQDPPKPAGMFGTIGDLILSRKAKESDNRAKREGLGLAAKNGKQKTKKRG